MSKLIMVLNDSWDLLNLYHSILTEEGYIVSLRRLGTNELDDIIEIKPNLIITDLELGKEVRGWVFIQQVRSNPTTTHIPIILCSGDTHRVRQLDAQLQLLNIAFVAKPFNIDDLLTSVTTALAQ